MKEKGPCHCTCLEFDSLHSCTSMTTLLSHFNTCSRKGKFILFTQHFWLCRFHSQMVYNHILQTIEQTLPFVGEGIRETRLVHVLHRAFENKLSLSRIELRIEFRKTEDKRFTQYWFSVILHRHTAVTQHGMVYLRKRLYAQNKTS